MAVPSLPFWLSSVNAEFGGNGWISSCAGPADLGIPLWCSNFAGRAAWHSTLTFGHRQDSSTSKFVGYSQFNNRNFGAMSPTTLLGHHVWYLQASTVARTESLSILFSGHPGPGNIVLEFEGIGSYTVPYRQSNSGNAWYSLDTYGVYTKLVAYNGRSVRVRIHAA